MSDVVVGSELPTGRLTAEDAEIAETAHVCGCEIPRILRDLCG